MKKYMIPAIAATMLSPIYATPAHATDAADAQVEYLNIYAGDFDFNDTDDGTLQVGAEYRFMPFLWNVVRPMIGANVTSDSALYGYGGFAFDFQLCENLYLTPNVVVGLYDEGSDEDLGGPIEFRSGVELSYKLPNESRLGIGFNHISNASIYDQNPGAETFMLTYSLPSSMIFGN